MEENKIQDESREKDYYTMVPRIAWLLADDPFEFTLWCVIKGITGENGECYVSTPDLAKLSMMSAGKVSKCRKRLIEKGLLIGECYREPGYPQPVYHLRIPNLYPKNSLIGQVFREFDTRIAVKDYLKNGGNIDDVLGEIFAHEGERSLGESFGKVNKMLSDKLLPKERSRGDRPLSRGERGTTPGERGTTPGETKNIQEEQPIEEPKENPTANAAAENQELSFDDLLRYYQNHISSWIPPNEKGLLQTWTNTYSPGVVAEALRVCVMEHDGQKEAIPGLLTKAQASAPIA